MGMTWGSEACRMGRVLRSSGHGRIRSPRNDAIRRLLRDSDLDFLCTLLADE
jgi:hypothetical protein